MPIPVIEIPLSNGGIALVDDQDAGLARWSWRNVGGYARRNGSSLGTIWMHRVVMGFARYDGRQVEHRDGNGLNNQRSNLRESTQAENLENVPARGGSSGYRGISWHKGARKWQAQVRHHGRIHYLGLFATEEQAHKAASTWRRDHMPFSTLDQPTTEEP